MTALDQTIAQVRPDGSTTKLTYDPAGNAAERCYWKPGLTVGTCQVVGSLGWTNPPGQSTSTTYDARNSRGGERHVPADQPGQGLTPSRYQRILI